ncbi:hypothetical protein [Helicobacter cinaedi]|nr:hypothetical protein [Helicobacter cinaedi]
MSKTQIQIAQNILNHCYWGNTNMTAEFIVENIKNKEFAKRIFSAIFQSSQAMIEDLRIIKEEWVREFIVEQNQKLGYFKRFYLEPRLDRLIQYYGITNAGKRREIYTIV